MRYQKKKKRKISTAKEYVYDRDIICIPKCLCSGTCIKIPRSKQIRETLGRNGLIGKIRLTSFMSESAIMSEIRSVFHVAMEEKHDFVFKTSGGNSKTISLPSLSASFKWTAGAICGKNSKMPIYFWRKTTLRYFLMFHVGMINLLNYCMHCFVPW